MSINFKKLEEQQIKYDSYLENVDKIVNKFEIYKDKIKVEYSLLTKIKINFNNKINDFNNDDRKLRIGIMGDIKCGKSSFLNSFLFDGKEILPKAATPTTANLTVIGYGAKNILEVEYYTLEEWENIESRANQPEIMQEVTVAKQLVKFAKDNSLDIQNILSKKKETFETDDFDQLKMLLNDYTSARGKYTAIVKMTKLFTNNNKLKNIEIIDTPGLNDPILSRTEKTREYMEYTDVVIFLSQVVPFLTEDEVEILIRQLPSKGIKKLLLIASKFDSAIIGAKNKGDFNFVFSDTCERIMSRAGEIVEKQINKLNLLGKNKLSEIIKVCKTPLIISSMANNISKLSTEKLSKEQKSFLDMYNNLWEGFKFTKEILEKIANFGNFNNIFQQVVNAKDDTLSEKAKTFIVDSKNELLDLLDDINKLVGNKIHLLLTKDLGNIKEQQKFINSRRNSIETKIEGVIGGAILEINQKKVDLAAKLRNDIRQYSDITEKTGAEVSVTYEEVSTSSWWNPFSWGNTRRIPHYETITYKYLDVSDAIDNVNTYANEAINNIEGIFNHAVDPKNMKKAMINSILENFNYADKNFDCDYFRLIIERTLNTIQFPIIKIDIDDAIGLISEKFSGQVRDADISNLKISQSKALKSIFTRIDQIFQPQFTSFSDQLTKIKSELTDKLLHDINKEYDGIQKEFDDLNNQISIYKEMIKTVALSKELL